MSHLLKLSAAELKDRNILRNALRKMFGDQYVKEDAEVRGYNRTTYHTNAALVVCKEAYGGYGDVGFAKAEGSESFGIFMDDLDFRKVKCKTMPTVRGDAGPKNPAELFTEFYTAQGVADAMEMQGYSTTQQVEENGDVLVKAYAY